MSGTSGLGGVLVSEDEMGEGGGRGGGGGGLVGRSKSDTDVEHGGLTVARALQMKACQGREDSNLGGR